jgi:hypothetical protein
LCHLAHPQSGPLHVPNVFHEPQASHDKLGNHIAGYYVRNSKTGRSSLNAQPRLAGRSNK